jgi:3-hydroxybutyryl-CoA dehydrogenase
MAAAVRGARPVHAEVQVIPVGVVGAGTMGRGIAQVAAAAGHPVRLVDRDATALTAARSALERVYARLAEKGRVSEAEGRAILARIEAATDISALADAGVVIEAVVEDPEVKRSASLGAKARRPSRMVGMHFFNPAALMKLVEIVPGLDTDPVVADAARELATGWGKTAVVASDTPGFIANRVARPYYGEALRLLEEGVADVPTIDAVMRDRGFKLGPFQLMDLVGTDVSLAVSTRMWEASFGEPRYRPFVTQVRMVEAERFGRKSNRGYYDYRGAAPLPSAPDHIDPAVADAIFRRIVGLLVNEAHDAVHFGVASAEDVDRAVTLGLNFPRGLIEWGTELGAATVAAWLDEMRGRTGEERYRVSARLREISSRAE